MRYMTLMILELLREGRALSSPHIREIGILELGTENVGLLLGLDDASG